MAEIWRGRRDALRGLGAPLTAHAGLWLSRYLTVQTWHRKDEPPGYGREEARSARDALIGAIERQPLPEGYPAAFEQWRISLNESNDAFAVARAPGRVIVGLGAKGAAEFGIALHHTWGVPILPGSSLKGIAALGARQHLNGFAGRPKPAEARPGGPTPYDALFGDVEEQGAVIFHDAWPAPAADGKNPLHRDVLTVHHPEYYQKGGEPRDTDSPNPIPFVSASGHWLVALSPAPGLPAAVAGRWLEVAWTALQLGLRHHGIGAKTNAGYGRVVLPDWDTVPISRIAAERSAAAADAATRDRRLTLPDAAARVADVLTSEGPEVLRAWFLSAGAREILGLPADEVHAETAVRALYRLHQAKGLTSAPGPWGAWASGALATAAPASTTASPPRTRRPFGPGELDAYFGRHTRKGSVQFDSLAKQLAAEPLTAEALEEAVVRLQASGAKPGHLKLVLAARDAARGG